MTSTDAQPAPAQRIEHISFEEMAEIAELAGGRLEPATDIEVIVIPICGWCRSALAACQRGEPGCCGYTIDNGAFVIKSVRAERPGDYYQFSQTEDDGYVSHDAYWPRRLFA